MSRSDGRLASHLVEENTARIFRWPEFLGGTGFGQSDVDPRGAAQDHLVAADLATTFDASEEWAERHRIESRLGTRPITNGPLVYANAEVGTVQLDKPGNKAWIYDGDHWKHKETEWRGEHLQSYQLERLMNASADLNPEEPPHTFTPESMAYWLKRTRRLFTGKCDKYNYVGPKTAEEDKLYEERKNAVALPTMGTGVNMFGGGGKPGELPVISFLMRQHNGDTVCVERDQYVSPHSRFFDCRGPCR